MQDEGEGQVFVDDVDVELFAADPAARHVEQGGHVGFHFFEERAAVHNLAARGAHHFAEIGDGGGKRGAWRDVRSPVPCGAHPALRA